MATRCRGLGEICARLTGPVRGQVVTRVQITERKTSIPQIVEIDAVDSRRQSILMTWILGGLPANLPWS
jgi:hypothetical protein